MEKSSIKGREIIKVVVESYDPEHGAVALNVIMDGPTRLIREAILDICKQNDLGLLCVPCEQVVGIGYIGGENEE